MLVGPLPWKKSGRETWQKCQGATGGGQEGIREGKGSEGGGRVTARELKSF